MLTTIQKSDAEIKAQVCQELRWDCRTETSPINVVVADGVVTLSGQVKYFGVKHAAEEAVCADIADTFERQAVANIQQLTVEVDEGAVRLSGLVPSWNHRCAVITAAGFAHGVREVVDDLRIAARA